MDIFNDAFVVKISTRHSYIFTSNEDLKFILPI